MAMPVILDNKIFIQHFLQVAKNETRLYLRGCVDRLFLWANYKSRKTTPLNKTEYRVTTYVR